MLPREDEKRPAIETPLVLLILILAVALLVFFGIRYEMKVRAETQAQAKRETSYQAALRSYAQILKPGMKRKEVENYLRANKIAFQQQSTGGSSLYDITQIGQDESTAWFCGKSDVFVKFHFTTFAQREHQFEANEGDTLDEITLFHLPNCP